METQTLASDKKNDELVFDLGDLDLYVYHVYTPQTYEDVSLTMVAENRGANNNNVSLVYRLDPEKKQWYEFSVESGGVWYLWAYQEESYNMLDNGGSLALKQGLAVNEYSMTCEGNI